VSPSTRKWLIGLAIAGVIGFPLLLAGYFSLGLFFAPPWPVAASSPVPPLIGEALWARANGGAETDLNPFTPVNVAQMVFCLAQAEGEGPGELRDEAQAECQKHYAPAFFAIEYLSEQHLRGAGLEQPGFRKGHAQFVTTIWMARSWTKAELLATIFERAGFGLGFQGLERAAQGYFGRPAAVLTLPQLALVAALAGGGGPDPWCEPADAAELRHRVLLRMRENGAIDERAFHAADTSELGLAAPPADHRECEHPR
jgi:hypothetical protein